MNNAQKQEELFSELREKYKNILRDRECILRNTKFEDILLVCEDYFSYETLSCNFLNRITDKYLHKCSIFHQINYKDPYFDFDKFTCQEDKIILNYLYENCETLKSSKISRAYELSEKVINENSNILDKILILTKSMYNSVHTLIFNLDTMKKLRESMGLKYYDRYTSRNSLTNGFFGIYKGIQIYVCELIKDDTIFVLMGNEKIGELSYNIGVYKHIESKNISPALILKEDFTYKINLDQVKKTSISGVVNE